MKMPLSCKHSLVFDIVLLSEMRNINLTMFESLFYDFSFIYDAPSSKRTGDVGVNIKKPFDFIAKTDRSF